MNLLSSFHDLNRTVPFGLPINPAATRNPYKYLLGFVEAAELISPFASGGRLSNGYDLNQLFEFGIYSFTTGDVVNAPLAGASILIVYGYAPNRVLQVQITSTTAIKSRLYTTSWSDWS